VGRLIGVIVFAICGLALANASSTTVGYGSTGYATVGYGGAPVADTPDSPEAPADSALALDSLQEALSLLSQGDGTVSYHVALEHGWLGFSNSRFDDTFKDMTAFGLSLGGSKSFGFGDRFEFIPVLDLDFRLFWGEYTYLYQSDVLVNRTRFGLLFTMDLRVALMTRVNLGVFYAEVGPQLGINLFQSSMIKFGEVFGVSNEDPGRFIFSIVPGLGVHYGDTEIGVRFVPDITNCWKSVGASMRSLQLVVSIWH